MKGLERVRRLYENRSRRAKDLKQKGKRIIGHMCIFPPRELITAAGMVPYRIMGSPLEPITEGDAYLETDCCPFVRSCLDLGVKGKYDFLDGVIWPHSCDNVHKTLDIYKEIVGPKSYFRYIDVPHMTDESSYEFLAGEFEELKKTLEQFSGVEITEARLRRAVKLHNENRALLRRLNAMRKPSPPLISGTEITQVMLVSLTIPVEESIQLLREVLDEVQAHNDDSAEKRARLLLYGGCIDDITFIRLLEQSGSDVVMDDLCFGTANFREDVKLNGDMVRNLAEHYLGHVTCPRNLWRSPGTRKEDLDNRFGYLRDYAREFHVNGAILYVLRYCDCYEFDVPDVRDYLLEAGVMSLHLEDDYSLTSMQGFRTRIEAFLEMIRQ